MGWNIFRWTTPHLQFLPACFDLLLQDFDPTLDGVQVFQQDFRIFVLW